MINSSKRLWSDESKQLCFPLHQRWSRGHNWLEAKAKDTKKSESKDSLSEDRHSRGQGQECSRPRPRTQAQVLSKNKKRSSGDLKKKKVFTKIFQAFSTKKRLPKKFSSTPQNFNNSKTSAVLEPRTGQFSRT